MAALVVAALSHCSWDEARALDQWTRTLAHHRLALPSPVQSPIHDCDHEYGCICRGATVVYSVDVTHCQPGQSSLLDQDALAATSYLVADFSASATPSAIGDEYLVPPTSGRQLRALYASLVI
jgi:hypothetical protein